MPCQSASLPAGVETTKCPHALPLLVHALCTQVQLNLQQAGSWDLESVFDSLVSGLRPRRSGARRGVFEAWRWRGVGWVRVGWVL